MKVKISELTGAALDWAVAKCEGRGIEFDDPHDPWLTRDGISDQPLHSYTPTTDWAQSGPLIEREGMSIGMVNEHWQAHLSEFGLWQDGNTPLIAAMRCYVASKLGDDVELPTELTQGKTK